MDNNPLARRTLERASTALQTNPIACLPEIVKLMKTLTGNSNQISITDLADVVQKDPVVLSKVLEAANTFGYNPNSTPVTSVNQAIHVIGFERIRSLAMSLMLIEQTARTQSSEEQRESAAQALTAGCLAHCLASQTSLVDAEQAFVCASLRSFGRIILASCMLEEFRAAQKLATEKPEDEAWREICGITPLELGYELLKAANLPEDVLATLRDLPPQTLGVLDRPPDQQMQMLTDFSARLAALSIAGESSASEYLEQVKALAGGFEKLMPNLAAEIPALVERASVQLEGYVRAFRLKSLPTRSLSRLTRRRGVFAEAKRQEEAARKGSAAPQASAKFPIAANEPADETAGAESSQATVAPKSERSPPSQPPAGAPPAGPAEWQNQLDRVAGMMEKSGAAPEHVLAAAVQAVAQIMAAPECLLLLGAAGQHRFTLRYGLGDAYKALGSRAQIDVRDRTVLGICLTRRENIMIHHAKDEKIAAYLPDWLKSQPGLGAYALLPVCDDKASYGVMLAGWPKSRQIALASEQVRCLRSLLALAGAAWVRGGG